MGRHTSSRKLRHMNGAFQRMYRADAAREQSRRCCYCGTDLHNGNTTADHVIPRSKAGATDRHNIKAACLACNSAKSAMSETRFKKKLRDPTGEPLSIQLAALRFAMSRRTDQAVKRIRALC